MNRAGEGKWYSFPIIVTVNQMARASRYIPVQGKRGESLERPSRSALPPEQLLLLFFLAPLHFNHNIIPPPIVVNQIITLLIGTIPRVVMRGMVVD